MNHSRILIEGIGGIGGVLAGRMIPAGYSPVLVTGNPSITDAIRKDGLSVSVLGEKTRARADVFTTLDEAADLGPFDSAYLVMKAQGAVDSARATLPLLSTDGFVVTFQNGIVEDAVAGAVGDRRVLSGIIAWGGTMHAPGIYERTSPGNTIVGELDGAVTDRVRSVAASLEPAGPVVVSSNMRGVLWSKLAINCTINSVGALTGETLGEMLDDSRIRRLFLRTYSEVVDTAEAHGVRLERIAANPKLLCLRANAGRITRIFKDAIVKQLGKKYRNVRSSTLQSLERGRKSEVDFLNGYVVARAREVGVATPVNKALTQFIKEIEDGSRPITRGNIEDLLIAIS